MKILERLGLFGLTVCLAGFMSCSNPADGVPKATVMAAKESAPAASSDYAYQFVEGSSIGFVGSKVTGSHNGGFKTFKGGFNVDGDDVSTAEGSVVIDMKSVWTDTDRLTGHLQTADFFDVAAFPEAVFTVSSIQQSGEEFTVTGDLTLHGVTKTISFPAMIEKKAGSFYLRAEFAIKRFDFEIKYPGKADDLIRDDVVIKLDLSAEATA
ncbi:MAG: YceI family protein [bacterium]|nr:YceI family protein [bacterium]